jgi:glycosyltransferase involved in cell wall biosynthesis
MKIIALVPVRNEAWVLEHSLACWSGFCDVVIVNDQMSTDATREICRRFPKVVLLESKPADVVSRLPQQARWRLLDAARNYDGHNLLWCTDADELTPPSIARRFFEQHEGDLAPRRVIECRFYNLWDSLAKYRQDLSYYGPLWKPMGFVDDRVVDYPRGDVRPLHEPRMPIEAGTDALKADGLPILHLQWTMWNRNQTKQAWYRCIDFMDKRMTAAEVNAFYSVTLREIYVHTEPVPQEWLADVTLPDASVDRQPAWQEAEILGWFGERGVEFFEPLEIWHVPSLRQEFRRRTGREPQPDRSYRPSRAVRARKLGRRVFNAVRRRILP